MPSPSRFFQPLETFFPIIGKLTKIFSNDWKKPVDFSNHWKKIFQSLENFSVALLCLLAPSPATAQGLDLAASLSADGALRIEFTPLPPAHLSESFTVGTPDGALLTPYDCPPPDLEDPFPAYTRPFALHYPPPQTDTVLVTYQLCDDTVCHFPETRTLTLSDAPASPSPPPSVAVLPGAAPSAPSPPSSPAFHTVSTLDGHATPEQFLRFLSPAIPASAPDASPSQPPSRWRHFLDNPAAYLRTHGWLPTVLLILLGGFLLNLTPCVLPMIPVNLAIIGASASSGATRPVRFALGLAYGTGMAAVYGLLGLAVVRTGGVFGSWNASPWFAWTMALLFAALGLAMFDLWNLDFSRWRRATKLANRARFPAALLAGGLSALLAGACVAPVLVAVLALSSTLYAAGQTRALLLPFLLGAGMALPWPLAAAGLTVLPKPGAWMAAVKKTFGVLILLLAAWYAWTAVDRFARVAEDGPEAPPNFTLLDLDAPGAAGRLDALLADAAADRRPVLLDFGARWCKSCAVMDATTLRDPAVTAALSGIDCISVLADAPSSPAAAPLLAAHSVLGYPAYRLLLPE